MKLTIGEVALLLGTEEERVFEWIEDAGLPAQRMRGEYRINRTELLEWATEKKVAVSPRAFAQSLSGSGIPTASDALRAGGVHYGVPSDEPAIAIRHIIQSLPLAHDADRETLLQFVLSRSAFGLSVLTDRIAVPQVRTPVVLPVLTRADGQRSGSVLSLAFLARPVMLAPDDARRVQAVFFLVSPTVTAHVAVLAKLTAGINSDVLRDAIERRAPVDDILRAMETAEASL